MSPATRFVPAACAACGAFFVAWMLMLAVPLGGQAWIGGSGSSTPGTARATM